MSYIKLSMSNKKAIALSNTKQSSLTQHQPVKQSYSSLDKIDRKQLSLKFSNSMVKSNKNNNGLLFKEMNTEKNQQKKNFISSQWPSSNKRKYLKNYQLPKIISPSKLKKHDISEYEEKIPENLLDDQQYQIKNDAKIHLNTVELSSPTKKARLLPIKKAISYAIATRTKAGTNGRQTKINQDIIIIEQKMIHNLRLYCVCDGHGLNGHLVSAFIKANLIKNLNLSLKKYHNPPSKEQMVELIYKVLYNTNQQLLDCEINTQLAGSTLIAVFIFNQKILTFNVGDSRAILLKQIKLDINKQEIQKIKIPQLSQVKVLQEYQWDIFELSIDQKPDRPDEKQRIQKFGGRVFAQTNQNGDQLGPARVWMKDVMMPGLAMSRSFGDKAGIKSGTNAEPQLIQHEIQNCDKFIVVASDGVWQYLQNEDVAKILKPFVQADDLNGGAQMLLKRSVQAWTKMNFARDDISFILIKLNSVQK